MLFELLSVFLPTYSSWFMSEFYLKNCRVPAKPVPTALSSKKLTYSLIFSSSSGVKSLNDSGS
jgi:hypothetical protein